MGQLVKRIDYCELPLDFWENVIFYDYFISFSGINETGPHITVWTSDGEQYYINTNELRDGRFERVIPFFEPMANKEKIKSGDFFYFDWEMIPRGWKYYYNQSNHCFIPNSVYEHFAKDLEKINNEEDLFARFMLWRDLLKQAYKKVFGVIIHEDVTTYIRFEEKIHVYNELYVGRSLYIDQISEEDIARLKNAAVWSIDYTEGEEHCFNRIKICVYFEKEEPLYIELSNHMNEYRFDNAPSGYTIFQKSKGGKIYWIRDDLYQANYHNVIEPFINYAGNRRFLSSPICGCIENKEGYIE